MNGISKATAGWPKAEEAMTAGAAQLPADTRVTVFPLSESEFVEQIYAGLFDLEAQGRIDLSFTDRPRQLIEERDHEFHIPSNKHIFYLEVGTAGRQPVTVCLDMHDSPRLASWSGFLECDVYVKRSYNRSFLERYLADRGDTYLGLMDKILPYGFNYHVVSANEHGRVSRLIRRLIRNRLDWREARNEVAEVTRALMRRWDPSGSKFYYDSSRLEIPASRSANAKVLLQTRLMDPAMAKSKNGRTLIEHLNSDRLELVRALKEGLGDRFVGGIIPHGFGRHCPPELTTHEGHSRGEYLDLVERNAIAVYSMGRANSNGWRFGEYLAMSRCIVSVPLVYEVSAPLQEGENLVSFESPAECVTACQTLLADPERIRSMREANEAYYHRYVKPSAIVGNALSNAMKHVHG